MTSSAAKADRNAPCPCGSGKKFKACCGGKIAQKASPGMDSESLHRQAQQAVARSDFSVAEHYFRQLVAAKPNDAYFQASLGQALCWLKRRKEGLQHLLKAARLLERQAGKTRDPQFVLQLSGQLGHWGEMAAAERLARMAVALAPKSPPALNNLALCLHRLNRNKEALPISQQVCQLLPDHPGCNILLAILEAKLIDSQQAITRLDQVIANNLEPDQTARAWLEKAGILDKAGRYDDAFFAMSKAGEMHAALSPFNPQQRELIFDTLGHNQEGFQRPLLQRWPKDTLIDDGLPKPAFLMGFLRSGTTLSEQVLGSHPRLLATDESSVIHEMSQELEKMTGIFGDSAKALSILTVPQIKQLRQFYWRRMREEYGDEVMRKQLVDKNALHTIDLGLISVVFPEAKILFALRDPRDVCLSCLMQPFSPAPATANLTSLPNIARQYGVVMDFWLAVGKHMQPDYLELRYEDTVNDFEATFKRVFAFLEVDWHPNALKFHQRAQNRYISTPSFSAVSQPLYNSSVRRWMNYRGYFEPVLAQLQPFAEAFGYGGASE
ncbi:sulfotransferase [Methylomonas sp. MgM2]